MADPVLMAIAAALVDKAAGAVASRGMGAMRSLAGLVRQWFAGDAEVVAALEEDSAESADSTESGRAEVVGAALERATAADPEFAEQLLSLWDKAGDELRADRGGVVNQVSGTVSGHVVQARDVTGGISLGNVPRGNG